MPVVKVTRLVALCQRQVRPAKSHAGTNREGTPLSRFRHPVAGFRLPSAVSWRDALIVLYCTSSLDSVAR